MVEIFFEGKKALGIAIGKVRKPFDHEYFNG